MSTLYGGFAHSCARGNSLAVSATADGRMNPEKMLAGFMAKFTPEIAALAEAALAKVRARFPNAIQMVYDNYNFLVISFGATERATELIVISRCPQVGKIVRSTS